MFAMAPPLLWGCVLAYVVIIVTAQPNEIGGQIIEDTTLSLADSPYLVTSDLVVEQNASLTIDPGVELRFSSGVGVLSHGILVANGTREQRIQLIGDNGYWKGIEWSEDAREVNLDIREENGVLTTSSKSVIQYTDVMMAGENGSSIMAIGIAPVVNNITVTDCLGDGLQLLDMVNDVQIIDSVISGNTGTGVSVITTGTGRLFIDGSQVTNNTGYGIHYGWNRPPAESDPEDFCTFNGSVSDYVYLDHDFFADALGDPNSCTQVLQSPPGTIITAYLVINFGSSGNSDVLFWDGNSTASDLLATLFPFRDVEGELVTSSENHMAITARRVSSSLNIRFRLFAFVQTEADYDFQLQNSIVSNNGLDGIRLDRSQRKIGIDNSIVQSNAEQGINADRIDGNLHLSSARVVENLGSGLEIANLFGSAIINQCAFLDNFLDGVRISVRSLYNVTSYTPTLSATNTSFSDNNALGFNINPTGGQCSTINVVDEIDLQECEIIRNGNGGIRINNPCWFTPQILTVTVANTTFVGNRNRAVELLRPTQIQFSNSLFVNHIGTDEVLLWIVTRVSSGYQSLIRNNIFSNNSATTILKVDGQIVRDTMDDITMQENIFDNNTCLNVINLQWELNGDFFETFRFDITDNHFTNNLPVHLFKGHDILPAVIVTYDKPYVTFTRNILINPEFTYQLNARGDNFGYTSRADMNWWGTTDEEQIQEYIIDQLDKYGYPLVQYFPYLVSDDRSDIVDANIPRSSVPFIRGNVIGGRVTGDVTLEKEAGPYYVDRDIFIPKPSTLQINPGTALHFAFYTGIVVQGKLVSNGTTAEKIRLESWTPYDMQSEDSLVRLVGGTEPWEGRLEVLENGVWSSVCGQDWTLLNTRVLCREFGFSDAVRFYTSENSNNNYNYYRSYPNYYSDYYQFDQDYVDEDINIPIWGDTWSCTGYELDTTMCKRMPLSPMCFEHSTDIHLECTRPRWAGILFPVNSGQSSLHNVIIKDAGFKIRSYDWRVFTNQYRTASIVSHNSDHDLKNINIISPSFGVIFYPDPFQSSSVWDSISISSCEKSYALQLYMPGDINSLNIRDCAYGIRYYDHTGQISQSIYHYAGEESKVDTCIDAITLDDEELAILVPPQMGSGSCQVDLTNNDLSGRIGIFAIYSNYRSAISVMDAGQDILTFDYVYSVDFNYATVSNTNEITIKYQLDNRRTFYIVAKALKDNSTDVVSSGQFTVRSSLFEETRFALQLNVQNAMFRMLHIENNLFLNNMYSIRLYYGYVNEITVQNNTFNGNSNPAIDISNAQETNLLVLMNIFINANNAVVLRIPNDIKFCNISNNLFSNNTTPAVVDIFGAVELTSVVTRHLDQPFQFTDNTFRHNIPSSIDIESGLRCVIFSKANRASFQYNHFGRMPSLVQHCIIVQLG